MYSYVHPTDWFIQKAKCYSCNFLFFCRCCRFQPTNQYSLMLPLFYFLQLKRRRLMIQVSGNVQCAQMFLVLLSGWIGNWFWRYEFLCIWRWPKWIHRFVGGGRFARQHEFSSVSYLCTPLESVQYFLHSNLNVSGALVEWIRWRLDSKQKRCSPTQTGNKTSTKNTMISVWNAEIRCGNWTKSKLQARSVSPFQL